MATKQKKALTPKQQVEKEIKKEIGKQRKRIRQAIRRLEKRGYSVPENILPPTPKHPTEKTLSRLTKITTDYLYKKSVYISPEGVTMKGTERHKMERSEAAKRAAETRRKFYEEPKGPNTAEPGGYGDGVIEEPEETYVALWRIQEMIDEWEPNPLWSQELTVMKAQDVYRLSNLLQSAIRNEGEDAVAQRVQDNALDIQDIVERVLHSSGSAYRELGREGINQDLNRFAALISGRPLNVQESAQYTEFGERFS